MVSTFQGSYRRLRLTPLQLAGRHGRGMFTVCIPRRTTSLGRSSRTPRGAVHSIPARCSNLCRQKAACASFAGSPRLQDVHTVPVSTTSLLCGAAECSSRNSSAAANVLGKLPCTSAGCAVGSMSTKTAYRSRWNRSYSKELLLFAFISQWTLINLVNQSRTLSSIETGRDFDNFEFQITASVERQHRHIQTYETLITAVRIGILNMVHSANH